MGKSNNTRGVVVSETPIPPSKRSNVVDEWEPNSKEPIRTKSLALLTKSKQKRLAIPEAEDDSAEASTVSNVYKPRPAGNHIVQILPGGGTKYLNKPIVQNVVDRSYPLKSHSLSASRPQAAVAFPMMQDVERFYAMMFKRVVPEMATASMTLACPQDAHNVPRYNSGDGYKETASVAVTGRLDLDWSIPAQNGWLDATTMFGVKFRDPVRSFVCWDGNPTNKTWTYGPTLFLCESNVGLTPGDASYNYLPFGPMSSTGNYQMHGPILYSGANSAKDRGYWWVDIGATIKVDNNSAAALFFKYDAFFEDGTDKNLSVSASIPSGGSFSYTVPPLIVPGYYISVGFRAAAGTLSPLTSLSLSITSNGGSFAHRSMRDLDKHLTGTGEMRHLSASFMYTNTSATLALQGAVAAKQVGKENDWRDYIQGRDPYHFIGSLSDAYVATANNGFYSFLRSEEGDFSPFTFTPIGTTSKRYIPYFNIQDDSQFEVVSLKIPEESGQAGYWTWSDCVEFTSDDTWWTYSLPTLSFQNWIEIKQIVSSVPQYHTNFSHVAELVSSIRALLKMGAMGIKHFGPHIIKVANWVEKNV